MRQVRALVVLIGATLLVASEVFSMAPASDQNSNVASPISQVPLTRDEMMKMMKSGKSKDAYAKELNIQTKMVDFINNGLEGLHEFMVTEQFTKYQFYMNFLSDMKEDGDYSRLVKMIEDGKGNTSEFKALWATVEDTVSKKQALLVKIEQPLNREQALAAMLDQAFSRRNVMVVNYKHAVAVNTKAKPNKWKVFKILSKLINTKTKR